MAIPSIYYERLSSNIDDICYMVDYKSKTFELKDFIIDSSWFEFIEFLYKFMDNNYNITIYEKQYGYSKPIWFRNVNLPRLIIKEYKTELSSEKLLYLKLIGDILYPPKNIKPKYLLKTYYI